MRSERQTTRHEVDAAQVHNLLRDHELRVLLDAPEGDYRIEYYTSTVRDAGSDFAQPVRSYRLLDRIRGGVTQEPWDRFDLDRQTTLVTHLMQYGGYRISKVVGGWTVRCPACGQTARGKIWETVPTACAGKGPPKCRHRYSDEDITDDVRAVG